MFLQLYIKILVFEYRRYIFVYLWKAIPGTTYLKNKHYLRPMVFLISETQRASIHTIWKLSPSLHHAKAVSELWNTTERWHTASSVKCWKTICMNALCLGLWHLALSDDGCRDFQRAPSAVTDGESTLHTMLHLSLVADHRWFVNFVYYVGWKRVNFEMWNNCHWSS